MRYYLLFTLICVTTLLTAQTIETSMISTAGNSDSNSVSQVSWTIGEPLIGRSKNVNEGFNQPYKPSDLVTAINNDLGSEILIYPNPSADFVTIEISESSENFNFTLFDTYGHQVGLDKNYDTKDMIINLSGLSPGVYILQVDSKTKQFVKTYRLLKQ